LVLAVPTHRSPLKAFPASQIVAVYHERWELELGYDEIKTTMLKREETIRCRSVAEVEQELWGILLAYNLVRLEICEPLTTSVSSRSASASWEHCGSS
jgi:hypothetical protein